MVFFSTTGLLLHVALFRLGTTHDCAIGQAGPSIWSRLPPAFPRGAHAADRVRSRARDEPAHVRVWAGRDADRTARCRGTASGWATEDRSSRVCISENERGRLGLISAGAPRPRLGRLAKYRH